MTAMADPWAPQSAEPHCAEMRITLLLRGKSGTAATRDHDPRANQVWKSRHISLPFHSPATAETNNGL